MFLQKHWNTGILWGEGNFKSHPQASGRSEFNTMLVYPSSVITICPTVWAAPRDNPAPRFQHRQSETTTNPSTHPWMFIHTLTLRHTHSATNISTHADPHALKYTRATHFHTDSHSKNHTRPAQIYSSHKDTNTWYLQIHSPKHRDTHCSSQTHAHSTG